jgi:membrane protein involved in colicin uptake
MEGNMNTVQRDPFVRRDADMRQLMLTLKELQEVVANAQMIWGTGRCMVDKKTVSDQVDLIARLLPESVKQASAIIKDEQNIRENARREANEQTAKAREDAQKAIDDAAREAQKTRDDNKKAAEDAARANANAMNAANALKAQAESEANAIRQKAQNAASALYAQAQQEANALLARAQQEAQMIRSDAENAARAAVAEENVYRMAVMQANELREETEKNMAAMRQNYVGALCNMMGEVDDYLVSLVSSIRAERQELINRR